MHVVAAMAVVTLASDVVEYRGQVAGFTARGRMLAD